MRPVNLANEPSFKLGAVLVVPATRELVRDDVAQAVEPRVMQVFVVLAQADGAVVGRQELIDRCWDGRIVGDNAVDRVISRIRQLAATVGADQFAVETITKVGYRLVRQASAPPAAPPGPLPAPPSALPDALPPPRNAPINRRLILGAAASSVAAAAGWGWSREPGEHRPPREARLLYENGKGAQTQLRRDQAQQAVAHFRQAVQIDPDYAEAWGALAAGYANLAEFAPDAEQESLATRAASAARRALDLDPHNADADIALILITPHFRHWAQVDRDCRRGLLQHPGHVRLRGKIARVMCDTGRWREGAAAFEVLVKAEPYRVAFHNQLGVALWGAGRIDEAEQVIDQAANLWPGHPEVMSTQLNFLTFTGHPEAAIALLNGSDSEPDRTATAFLAGVRALATRSPTEVDQALAVLTTPIPLLPAKTAVPLLAALNALDAAFSRLGDYLLGKPGFAGGPRVPLGRLSRRETDFLFAPPADRLRADPRFRQLTAAIGLDDFWRTTGSAPDWRR